LSFKAKLLFSYCLIVFLSFGLISFFLDKNLERNSLQDIQSSLINEGALIQNQIGLEYFKESSRQNLYDLVNNLSRRIQSRLTVIDAQGKVLADSEKSLKETALLENHSHRKEVRAALDGAIGMDIRYSSTLKINMLYVALPIKEGVGLFGVLRLALPLERVEDTLAVTRKIVTQGLFFALILAFFLASLILTQITKPINKMIQISKKYAQGDFSSRILLHSKDEIGNLAATLNSMAEDLQEKIKEIQTQNQKLSVVSNSMVEGVIVVDKSAHIVSLNPTIERIFNVSKEAAIGKFFLEVIRNNEISDVIQRVLSEKTSLSGEINLVLPIRGIFRFNAAPIFDNNQIDGCLIVLHDITEIRRLETMRRDFVANVSHELKTPLTSIKGFVETLLEGALEDKENSRSFLNIIHLNAERLNNLVNDLLSLSEIESKEIKLKKTGFTLRGRFEEIIRGFSSQIEKRNLTILNELGQELVVFADQDKLDQVITNLLDNAIKFNKDKGTVRIYSSLENNMARITIEDTGIGIPEKDVLRIFERFYRVDKARSREMGGTGLGLSIVKHLVELHGGIVGVQSTEGLGSTFFFTLPQGTSQKLQ